MVFYLFLPSVPRTFGDYCSTSTPFRLRFNNYKACYRRFRLGSSVPQMDFFRHCSGNGHNGFLEDIRFAIIDKLVRGGG